MCTNYALLPVLCLIFLSQACKRKEQGPIKSASNKPARSFFCAPYKATFAPTEKTYLPQEKGMDLLISSGSYLWNPGDTLDVYFLDGTQEICDSVIKTASEWSLYANIYFRQTYFIEQSEIRVTFWRGAWRSLVGRQADCNHVTMFLEGLDYAGYTPAEFKRTVLHEFGHAIGLEHEQLHPLANIQWDTVAVYRYYCDTLHWSKTDVNLFVLSPINTSSINYTQYDSLSIMHYSVPLWMTKNGFSVDFNNDLSEGDKAGIALFYPFYNKAGNSQ